MKIAYCTDIHYGSNPVSRKDNYNSSILRKLAYCLETASKNHCPLFIGGDLFDRPNINFYNLILLIDVFKRFNVDVYINRGNASHDGCLENSPLTLMEQAGLIKTSDGFDYVDFDDTRVIFAPNHLDPMSREEFVVEGKKNWLMTHHLVVEKETIYSHFLMKDFKTECDLVFCADYHPYQGTVEFDNVKFIAPGSIARRKLTKDNLEKVPRMVIVDGDDIEYINVPFEEDVWVEKEESAIEENEMGLGSLETEIESFSENMTLQEAWVKFSKQTNMTKDVFEYLNERLGFAK